TVLTDEARLRQVVAAAEVYLKVAAPELLPVSFSFEQDREHACLSLVASTRANGAAHRNLVDRELCLSPEFEELRRLARQLAASALKVRCLAHAAWTRRASASRSTPRTRCASPPWPTPCRSSSGAPCRTRATV